MKPHLVELMMDPCGNYIFQKLAERGDDALRNSILLSVKDAIVSASTNPHGTRCVQSLIALCLTPSQIAVVLTALQGSVAFLASHVNGTHVIQRCVQCYPCASCDAFYQEIIQGAVEISTHRHGCCVVQRFFSAAPPRYQAQLIEQVVAHSCVIIPNPFGNYVVQYLMQHGSREQAVQVGRSVLGHVVEYCCQKYSCNVVERVILLGDEDLSEAIVMEIVQCSHLELLLHHDFANYVIQRLLRNVSREARKTLIDAIAPYASGLGKSTGGRHILSVVHEVVHSSDL